MTLVINRPERLMEKPGAVIFDTDNTLYPYDKSHAKALEATRQKAVRVLGITHAQFDEAFDEARRQIKARLLNTASSHSRLLYFQRMLELIGLRTQVLMALDFEQTYWRVFLMNSQLFEGIKGLLDDLRLHGIPTAIVTDLTAQIQFRKIVYFGLDHYFDYVVTSEEAGCDKPHAAAFNLAVEKFGPVNGPFWMVGDNPICDIAGARQTIGAVTLQKKHDGVHVMEGEAGPDVLFEDYADLRSFVSKRIADHL